MATLEDYRAKTRERVQRHRQRQAEAHELRITLVLPASLVAALDAAKGPAGRSGVVREALAEWLRSQAPPAPKKPVRKSAPASKPVDKPAAKPAAKRRPRRVLA